MADHQPRHVFISYVRENQDQVDRLCHDLESHGVNIWLDRNNIDPGIFWEDAIRKAIRDGAFFISCFSEEYNERTTTHMNEELNLAIEVLRKRPREQAWFIPIVLSGDVPDWEIFPGKTLKSIQWVPLYEDWNAGIQRIISVIKPIPPEIQKLINGLRSEDADVRKSAAQALGKIGPGAESAVPTLIGVLKDKDNKKYVRESAIKALKKIGPASKEAISVLVQTIIDTNEEDPFRRGIAYTFGEFGPLARRAVPALAKALKVESGDAIEFIVVMLGKIGPAAEPAVPALIEAFKDKRHWVRGLVSDALGDIGPEAKLAVPTLYEALKDGNEIVRYRAAQALGKIGRAAIPALAVALKDENLYVRYNAAQALRKIGPEPKLAVPALIEALKDGNELVRYRAAMTLWQIDPKAKAMAVPALIEALKSKNSSVRADAAWSLEEINTPEAQKALEEYNKQKAK